MSITRQNPNTIHLGGDFTVINDMAAKAAITPGHLVERVNTGGVWQWQKNSNTTATKPNEFAVALDHAMANKGVDDAYAIGDLVEVGIGHKGSSWWMLIASGQNIAYGDKLQSAGDGTLAIYTDRAIMAVALETKANVTVTTRIRVEAL